MDRPSLAEDPVAEAHVAGGVRSLAERSLERRLRRAVRRPVGVAPHVGASAGPKSMSR